MPDKDLQRLTNSVVYIDHGQGSRHLLPARRNHINLESEDRRATHALHQRHNHEHPADVFLRPNNPDCYLELIDLYDMATRPLSLALQHGRPSLGRWEISTLEPIVLHVDPSFGTITSRNSRVCQI